MEHFLKQNGPHPAFMSARRGFNSMNPRQERTESQRDGKLYVFIHLFGKGKRTGDCVLKMSEKDSAAVLYCVSCDL